MVRNLLENAVRACEEGVKIQILWEEGQLRILDDGIGMEAGELEKILEPFYRVDKARSRERGGKRTGTGPLCGNHPAASGRDPGGERAGKGNRNFCDFYNSLIC